MPDLFAPLMTPMVDPKNGIATPHWSNYFNRITSEVATFEDVPEELNPSTLLGRGSSGVGAAESVTLGSGLSMSGSVLSVSASGVTPFGNTELTVSDLSGFFALTLQPGSTLTADRTLNLTTGDASRTVTLSGNPTLSDWFDQSVKTGASPAFTGLSVNGHAFTVGGAPTLNDWFNQNVKSTASPTFNNVDATSYSVNTNAGVSGTFTLVTVGGPGDVVLIVENGLVTFYS